MALKKLKDGRLQVKKGVTFERPKEKQYKLKPKVKKAWLEALRSGKFRQTTGYLCQMGGHGSHPKYCCLGVLEKVYGNADNEALDGRSDLAYDIAAELDLTQLGALNSPVAYGKKTRDAYHGGWEQAKAYTCAELNDDAGLTFKQIADIIEVQF